MRGRRIVGRIGLIAATAVLVVGGAACSSGDDHDADTTTTTGTQTTTASPTTAADDTTEADDDADQDPGGEDGDGTDGGGDGDNGGGAAPAGFTDAEESYLDWVGQREGMTDDVAQARVDLGYQACNRIADGWEDQEIIAEIARQVQGPSIAGPAVGGAHRFLCPTEGKTWPDDGPPASGFSDAEEDYLQWVGQREDMSQEVAQWRVDQGYEICARIADGDPDHEIIADIDREVQGPSIAGPAVSGAHKYLC